MGFFRSAMACAVSGLLATAVLAGSPALAGSPTAYDPACMPAPAPDPSTAPTRILINGDSMSNGFSGDFTWRYFFYQHLVSTGANIDFVGPWSDLIDRTTSEWGNHEYAVCAFDQDHLARGGGQLAGQLVPGFYDPSASNIAWAVSTYQPDIVVEYLGYNDLTRPRSKTDSRPYSVAEVLANAKAYLDQVRAVRPTATIVMADLNWAQVPVNQTDENKRLVQLAPQYNAALKSAIANTDPATRWSTEESKVVFADVDHYWQGYADTYDGAHPTSQGEGHIAQGMEDAFAGLGLGAPSNASEVFPPIGPRVAPVLNATGVVGRLTLTWTPPPGETRMIPYCREPAVSADWTQLPDVAHTLDASSNGVVLTTCRPGVTIAKGHSYQLVVHAAKGTAVAADVVSNRVDLTVTQSAPLDRVTGFVARSGYRAVQLTWRPVAGASGYTVGWKRAGESSYHHLAATGAGYRFTGLVGWGTYWFQVRAVGAPISGPYSSPLSATPTGLLATVHRPVLTRLSGHRVGLSWNKVAHATRYEVEYRVGRGSWKVLGSATRTRFVTRGFVKGRSYAFRVQARRGTLAGGFSPAARITA